MFSINRLFYLSFKVKLQFFKTFLLPHFDYCLSLCIYFSKTVLSKLFKCYFIVLNKLFKFDFSNMNLSSINNYLKKYGLFCFHYRVLYRLLLFSHKIVNSKSGPICLKEALSFKELSMIPYNLRSNIQFSIESCRTHYGDLTFHAFFSKLLNNSCINQINDSIINFKSFISLNLDTLVGKFLKIFPKFNIDLPNLFVKL